MTGRFINADVYTDTGSCSPLSTNMFAYCENNALRRYDSNGNWYEDFSDYDRHLHAIRNRSSYSIDNELRNTAFQNFNYNKKIFNGYRNYIYGQRSCRQISCLVYNVLQQSIGKYGCVPIAIYNVMRTITAYPSLPQIICELELNKEYAMNGFPMAAALRYFDAHSVRYHRYNHYYSFMSGLSRYTIAVVWTNNNDHVYCIINIGKGNWRTLNRRGDDTDFQKINWSNVEKAFLYAFGIVVFNRR